MVSQLVHSALLLRESLGLYFIKMLIARSSYDSFLTVVIWRKGESFLSDHYRFLNMSIQRLYTSTKTPLLKGVNCSWHCCMDDGINRPNNYTTSGGNRRDFSPEVYIGLHTQVFHNPYIWQCLKFDKCPGTRGKGSVGTGSKGQQAVDVLPTQHSLVLTQVQASLHGRIHIPWGEDKQLSK